MSIDYQKAKKIAEDEVKVMKAACEVTPLKYDDLDLFCKTLVQNTCEELNKKIAITIPLEIFADALMTRFVNCPPAIVGFSRMPRYQRLFVHEGVLFLAEHMSKPEFAKGYLDFLNEIQKVD